MAGLGGHLPHGVGVEDLARIGQEGIELRLRHEGLPDFERHLDRAGNRIALALVTLGLYVAGSLLMLHSLGPQYRGVPLLALGGYALVLWFTLRLAAGISRSGRL